jgi:DNA-binding CsgD family transcriptional regulator
MLRGRENEGSVLDELLSRVRAGESGALVLRGQPGIGKTALLDHAAAAASGFRVLRAGGVEAELELAYAGLHQLCTPLLAAIDRLPAPQQDAVRTAFGLAAGAPPDKFFVGLAVLGLLSESTREQPLLCLVDDAQWLDDASAQSIAFVARRLHAESVALVFATRREDDDEFAGLPSMFVPPLSDADARDLLDSIIPARLDERIRERVLAEAEGNPLALIELPRGSSPAALAGGMAIPGGSPLAARIEASFARRLAQLPADTQRLLWVAAADPVGDPALLWRAASLLEIPGDAAAAAEADGLIDVGIRVRFRHPLVRAAAYRAAPPDVRRAIHYALSECIDVEVDPDRRVWHRSEALTEPDEEVAAELERAAARAHARAGAAAAAAFLERSTRLTPDPSRRASRALAAAEMNLTAGDPEAAVRLLNLTGTERLDELHLARLDCLRATLAFVQRHAAESPQLMLAAATRLAPVDSDLALETYLKALEAALTIGQRDKIEEIAAALASHERAGPPTPTEMLMLAHAQFVIGRHAAGKTLVQQALATFGEPGRFARADEIRGLIFAWLYALSIWDDEMCESLAARAVKTARDVGALTDLPTALEFRATMRIFAGDFQSAHGDIQEGRDLARATGSVVPVDALALLAAWQDEPRVAVTAIEAVIAEGHARGEKLPFNHFATAVLHNGGARYDLAIAAALRSNEDHLKGGSALVQPELIEAAVRSGRRDLAESAYDRLTRLMELASSEWAAGVDAGARALLAESTADAEASYQLAINRLEQTGIRTDLARARLRYGEWLRRERRRSDAREQLELAHESFRVIGAASFAERAARELLAAGGRAPAAKAQSRTRLTAQESQVARMAREGLTNSAIGAQLFISPRTVEYHLHKVFSKLGITARGELVSSLPKELQHAEP